MNLLVRVQLGYPPNFKFLGHLEVPYKYVEGEKEEGNKEEE